MGLGDWLKRKGKDSVDYAKDNVNYKEVRQTGENIKDMATVILSPKETIKHARQETFQEAKIRLGVSDFDLIQNYRNYAYICYISLFFTAICFIGTLYNLFVKHSLFSAIVMLSIMSLCLANSFKYSFRAFQIKHQKLCSVKEWWERATEWLPKL